MLSEPSNADAITWLPHGRAFIIKDRQKFSNHVLPVYFRKTKYTSFTRKLNRWNFSRVNRGSEIGAYSHEFFQRGNEALCIQMYCKNDRAKFAVSTKVNSKKKINESSTTEPSKLPSPLPTRPSAEQARRVPVTELPQLPGLFSKGLTPTASPALQARAALLGRQPVMPKDLLTQVFVRNSMNTFQAPLGQMPSQNQDVGSIFRMQQLAAIQRHFQGPPVLPRQTSPFTNYRASAA